MAPDWSATKSPLANVPDPGAPDAVAPAYLEAAVAPVRPPVDTAPLKAGLFRNPAVTTWTIVNPAVWATGVVPSAPRVTVQVVPDTLVTAMISLVFPEAVSATWNCVTPVDAAGKDDDDATVQDSLVPEPGAVVPPEETVVWG
jgi:hypothetical protein